MVVGCPKPRKDGGRITPKGIVLAPTRHRNGIKKPLLSGTVVRFTSVLRRYGLNNAKLVQSSK